MKTSTITWTDASERLPDAETNVLLGLSDGFTCEGFLTYDGDDKPLWIDVCAVRIDGGTVTHWAEMPTLEQGI